MVLSLVKRFLDGNEREIRRLQKIVAIANSFQDRFSAMSDSELKAKTPEFKARISNPFSCSESLDSLLPEAFALVREASQRTIGLRHYDVQFMGGMILHEGRIAEMKTGEGKTLVATLPVYLNALTGKGVHLVTVNDYLAKRDRYWMGPLYEFLGLTVGVIQHDMDALARQAAYSCDITFATNNEIGFDYLRDNMVTHKNQCVLRELNYAIVDEVDSILVDEARTPLIISGLGGESTDLYYKFSQLVRNLVKDKDYHVDEKAHAAPLTDEGVGKVEKLLHVDNLYANENFELTHHLNAALKAKELFKRDDDYVVKDGEIVIVDEFTGRYMFGRRYSDGLHQAIEAKEGVKVRQEDQTLATITFQNFFRLYKKLAGMTGTAATEEEEFRKIYNLDVVVIPTHRSMIRKDYPDQIYKSEQGKFRAVVKEIEDLHKRGQPVLVGTRSIEKSEMLSGLLKKCGIPHQVLNAKYHEKEAEIIAQAGHFGSVTIATNMAGRGVDIILGGNPPDPEENKKVLNLGGLHIIGTERHESRRIDNQLRGRSGRQGDPGSSRFYISLEDELMRLFGSDRITGIMTRLGMDEDTPIEHGLITKQIEHAQARVESHNFEIRRQVMEYDHVMNEQRKVIYTDRKKVIQELASVKQLVLDIMQRYLTRFITMYVNNDLPADQWDLNALRTGIKEIITVSLQDETKMLDWDGKKTSSQEIKEQLIRLALATYEGKEQKIGPETMREIERMILLHIIDTKWIDHLYNMDALREGIGLRAYGQKDPRIEYQFEGFEMFKNMQQAIEEDMVKYLFKVQMVPQERRSNYRVTSTNRDENGEKTKPVRRSEAKVGRNDPCTCGSGKKYKKCHGA